jgi:Cache domain
LVSTLTRRFVILLLVALVPLALIAYSDINAPQTPPIAEANSLAAELDSLLQLRLTETFTIAAFPSIRAFAATDPASRAERAAVALNELQAWVAADAPVREVFVVDAQGKTILSTGKDWNQDWSMREFVSAALAGKLDVSAVSHDVNEFSQYYAAPILDNRGSVAGALVVRIAAQELWGTVNAESDKSRGIYAVLVDENGVRLADGGDATLIMAALAPLPMEQQTRVTREYTYGAQVSLVRATNLDRAAELIRSGAEDTLAPSDFDVKSLAAQRLATKPWTVLVLSAAPPTGPILSRFFLPLLAAVLGAGLGALLLRR